MNVVRFLLLALVLTPAANAVQLQDKDRDKLDQTRGKAGTIRRADPRQVQSPRPSASERASQRRGVEEKARAERSPAAPRGKLP